MGGEYRASCEESKRAMKEEIKQRKIQSYERYIIRKNKIIFLYKTNFKRTINLHKFSRKFLLLRS